MLSNIFPLQMCSIYREIWLETLTESLDLKNYLLTSKNDNFFPKKIDEQTLLALCTIVLNTKIFFSVKVNRSQSFQWLNLISFVTNEWLVLLKCTIIHLFIALSLHNSKVVNDCVDGSKKKFNNDWNLHLEWSSHHYTQWALIFYFMFHWPWL